jgi:hypothetical protein
MITILDLKAEFAKLKLLRGRTPQMTEGDRKGSGGFATLAPYRDGNIFSAKFSGDGAWERHPNGDELVQIVEGSATLYIMAEDGPKTYAVSAGMLVIAPGNVAPLPLARGCRADDRDAEADRAPDGRRRRSADAHEVAALGQYRGKVALS